MRGNGISLYYLTAKCWDCVSEQNSVRFVCCGKLKTDEFKQNDERWKKSDYDNICSTEPVESGRYRPVYSCDNPIFNKPEYKDKKYKFTIWGKGCALTALATLINYYKNTYNLPISSTNPKELNVFLSSHTYNDELCYNKMGKINFSCIEVYTKFLNIKGKWK